MVIIMLDVKKDIWKKAIGTTSSFENGIGNNPYTGMVGNFDNQYLSYGVLSWNFGMNTLQPLFLKLFNNYPQIAQIILPNGGKDLFNALNNHTEKQWALTIQKNNIIIDPWKTALINLGNTPEFQSIQDNAMKYYRDGAVQLCQKYKLTTDRAFCLFFDIMVQNGSIKNFTITETQYINKLKSIAIAVSKQSNPQFQADVLNRKMAIVNGSGIVHGDNYQFDFNDKNAIINLDDATVNAINTLVIKGISSSPQYWIENTSIGDLARGDYVGLLIQKSAAIILKNPNINLNNSITLFVNKGIISSPQYWIENTIAGKQIQGEYLATIIKKIINFI